MNDSQRERKKIIQNHYRRSQENKALVRFELQVDAQAKLRFEEIVKAIADELTSPWDERRRMAQARAMAFEHITQGMVHEFVGLKTQIEHLRTEITALSPAFFIDPNQDTALPEAIAALPDDPKQLKRVLAKTFIEAQHTKQVMLKFKNSSEQYRKLHEVSTTYNDELKKQLLAAGIEVE